MKSNKPHSTILQVLGRSAHATVVLLAQEGASDLVAQSWKTSSGYRFGKRRVRPLCHPTVRQQTWQEIITTELEYLLSSYGLTEEHSSIPKASSWSGYFPSRFADPPLLNSKESQAELSTEKTYVWQRRQVISRGQSLLPQ